MSGCWSYIGNIRRGMQILSLDTHCIYVGTILHELMHDLGFRHEQNRPDRDDYVTIKWDNIKPDSFSQDQFKKYPQGIDYGIPYDSHSIMHYGSRFFSRNGKPTIVPKIAGVTLSDPLARTEAKIMTDSDILAVRIQYKCTDSTLTPIPTT